jgi:hypothetical protein
MRSESTTLQKALKSALSCGRGSRKIISGRSNKACSLSSQGAVKLLGSLGVAFFTVLSMVFREHHSFSSPAPNRGHRRPPSRRWSRSRNRTPSYRGPTFELLSNNGLTPAGLFIVWHCEVSLAMLRFDRFVSAMPSATHRVRRPQ